MSAEKPGNQRSAVIDRRYSGELFKSSDSRATSVLFRVRGARWRQLVALERLHHQLNGRIGVPRAAHFDAPQWIAVAYLGVVGSAGAFVLWVFALSRTSPTKTAVTITVNPVFASIVGALAIGEGIGLNLVAGLMAVAVGIWIATTAAPASGS